VLVKRFCFSIIQETDRGGLNAAYFNFEDERIENDPIVLSDFLTVLKREYEKNNTYLLLDEIQKISKWDVWIRRIYDTESYNILITGSTSKLVGLSLPSTLSGRILSILVLPLRFIEFLKFKNVKIDFERAKASENDKARLISLLEEYLRYGGLPEVVLAPSYKKVLILQEYYRTIVSRDISGGKIRNMELLDKFLKLMARSKQVSISKMYNVLKGAGYKVGKGTLVEYLDKAIEAFFIYTVPVHYESLKARVQMPKKVYLSDMGYLTAIVPKIDLGRLLENAVYLELIRRYWHDPRVEITYWTDGRREVDFLVKKGKEVIELIQVSYDISDPDTKNREIDGLKKAMRRLGIKKRTIITGFQYSRIKELNTIIEIIPYWEWEQRKQPKYCIW